MQAVSIRAPWEGACTSLKSRGEGPVMSIRPLVVRCGVAEPSGKPAPFGQVTLYNDNIIDRAFMALFRSKMEKFTGDSHAHFFFFFFHCFHATLFKHTLPQPFLISPGLANVEDSLVVVFLRT